MTKTLTEQWREGTLPVGSYYIKLVGDVERIDFFEGLEWERTKDFGIEEVLGPVPGYNEYLVLSDFKKIEEDAIYNLVKIHTEQLEKQLEIATKALKDIQVRSQRDWDEYDCMSCATRALVDIVKLKVVK